MTDGSDHRFFAGWRSDPFFFDVTGALKDFQFTGNDYFIDKDVCSIVLEVPNSALGAKTVGLWARTVDGASGRWVQADRGARPSQAVFLPGDERDAYLAGHRRMTPVSSMSLRTRCNTPEGILRRTLGG